MGGESIGVSTIRHTDIGKPVSQSTKKGVGAATDALVLPTHCESYNYFI